MTEQLQGGPPRGDERDEAIERIVDTQGVSYADARRIYDGSHEPRVGVADSHPDSTMVLPARHHGPFNEEVSRLHDEIRATGLKSQLAPNKIGPKMARLVMNKKASDYDIAATNEIKQRRIDELTYRGDDSPE